MFNKTFKKKCKLNKITCTFPKKGKRLKMTVTKKKMYKTMFFLSRESPTLENKELFQS